MLTSNMTSLYTECMNGLHEIGIASEGLQGGRLIGLEEVAEVILLGIEIGELPPGHVVLEVTPEPLNRVQLRAIRRQEEQPYVLRQGKPLGRMCPTIVQQEDIQAGGEGLREGLDEELEQLGVQRGPLQQEPVPCGGFHGAIDIEPLEGMLDGSDRLHTTGGQAPPSDSQEAEAAVVLAEDTDGASIGGRDDLLEAFYTGSLERGNGLRIVLCGWGVAP
jgi:hypothetical protein